ncbi:unnamed protein product, partial [Ectocarpus sp. 6 AP-2014]
MESGEPAVDFLSRRLPRMRGGPLPALEPRRTGELDEDATELPDCGPSYLAMGPRQKTAATKKVRVPIPATCHRLLRVRVEQCRQRQRPPDRNQRQRRVRARLKRRQEHLGPRPAQRRVTQARASKSVRPVLTESTWALNSSTLSRPAG